jgi:hypothetical protein
VVPHSTPACQPIQNLFHSQDGVMEVSIDKVKTKAYFEVINIMDDLDPYPYLLGID